MRNKTIVEIAFDLGIRWDRTYENDLRGYLETCLHVLNTTSKFHNTLPKDTCNRDRIIDAKGLTCYNRFCTSEHK